MPNQHIAMVLNSFFPENKGGTEIYVLNLARFLRNSGWAVSIIISKTDTISELYYYDGFPVYCFRILKHPSKAEIVGSICPSGVTEFMQILDKINPSIVHFHSFNRAISSWHLCAAKEKGYKTVFTAHLGGVFCQRGDYLYKGAYECDGYVSERKCLSCFIHQKGIPFSGLQALLCVKLGSKRFLRDLYPASFSIIKNKLTELERINTYCDVIVAISDWIQRTYLLNKVNHSILVKQGIDSRLFKSEPKTFNKDRIVISFVGRLYPIKRIELLLKALIQIDSPRYYLQLLTTTHDYSYREYIKTLVSNLKNCFWFEDLSQTEVNEKLDEADILCLPSQNECAPLVVLEAFAKGIPVIGSNIPGISDSVTDGVNGLLFENGSVDSLTAVLQRILYEKDLLKHLRDHVRSPRCIDDVGADMNDIYKGILK